MTRFNAWRGVAEIPFTGHALVPVAEPLSAGLLPVAPALIRQAGSALPVRRLRSVSNHVCTAPLDTGSRMAATLAWNALTQAEIDSLEAFLRVTCGDGTLGFGVRLDGAGQETAMIATGPLTMTRIGGAGAPLYAAELTAIELIGVTA